jgi:signal transduction histidine kinase
LWWCANRFTGDPDLHSWIGVWEVSRHVGFFLIVALVGSALRAKSDIAAERIALLEHSQRLEREIVNISEAEQRRIGQDLHDGLCQYLAGLTCAASSLRDDLQNLHLNAEAKTADELSKLLQDAVVQTRDRARKLVPAHISDLGLVVALDSLAQSVTRLHGINCTFQCHASSAHCNEHNAVHFYRIAQEAINNATRHGKARNIIVSLDAEDHSM